VCRCATLKLVLLKPSLSDMLVGITNGVANCVAKRSSFATAKVTLVATSFGIANGQICNSAKMHQTYTYTGEYACMYTYLGEYKCMYAYIGEYACVYIYIYR
jgi:hypothetical protein